jgi:hypothetical protein
MSILKNLISPVQLRSTERLIIMSKREITFLAQRLGAEEDATDVRMLRLNSFAQATRCLSHFERRDMTVEAQFDREEYFVRTEIHRMQVPDPLDARICFNQRANRLQRFMIESFANQ